MTLKTATPGFEAFPGISESRAKGRLQLPVPVRAQMPGARPGGYALRVAADMASYDAGVAAGVLSALRAATGPLDKQELADIINGDSTLEFAMDLLHKAGVGPIDWEQRRKTCKVSVSTSPGGKIWIGRHGMDEIAEFFSVLDAAADHGEALQANLGELIECANSAQILVDSAG